MRFAFIGAERARHSLPKLCRMLRVSRSGYYAWRRREPSRHALEDARLGALVVAAHQAGRGTYGSPQDARRASRGGERTSRKRVARLMRERGIVGEMRKGWRHPSSAPTDATCPPNMLDRGSKSGTEPGLGQRHHLRPDVGGMAVPGGGGGPVLATVVGWSMQSHMETDLVLAPWRWRSAAAAGPGLLQHSDRGSQYASDDYQRALREHGIECSMSGGGTAGTTPSSRASSPR